MRARPAELSDAQVVQALRDAWGVAVTELRYVPRGFGSYHWQAGTRESSLFVTADDLDHKSWLGEGRERTFAGLRIALATALRLRREAGLSFVAAPLPTCAGQPLHRVSPRYSLAAFPFLDVQPGEAARDEVLVLLGRLHLATGTVAAGAPRRGVALAGRSDLEAALRQLDRPWTGGPFSEPARSALATRAAAVARWLATFDDLGSRVAPQWVITHGEPHPGNLIRTAAGPALVDWDTVALAPPERDLWLLDDGSAGALATYTATTGREPDPQALALFRLTWTLTNIAAFVAELRAEHRRNADTEKAWRCLVDDLDPAWDGRTRG